MRYITWNKKIKILFCGIIGLTVMSCGRDYTGNYVSSCYHDARVWNLDMKSQLTISKDDSATDVGIGGEHYVKELYTEMYDSTQSNCSGFPVMVLRVTETFSISSEYSGTDTVSGYIQSAYLTPESSAFTNVLNSNDYCYTEDVWVTDQQTDIVGCSDLEIPDSDEEAYNTMRLDSNALNMGEDHLTVILESIPKIYSFYRQ